MIACSLVMQHWLSRSLRGENRSAAVQREKHASPRLLQSSHGKGSEVGGLSSGTVGLLPVLISCRLLYIIRVLPLQSVFSSPFTANPSIRSVSSLSIIRLPLTPATTGQPSVERKHSRNGLITSHQYGRSHIATGSHSALTR
jgi:hypothetical protein